MIDLSRPQRPELRVRGRRRHRARGGGAGGSIRSSGIRRRRPTKDWSRRSICADCAQLRQLIWNLVRNAVQASSAGSEVPVVVQHQQGATVARGALRQGPRRRAWCRGQAAHLRRLLHDARSGNRRGPGGGQAHRRRPRLLHRRRERVRSRRDLHGPARRSRIRCRSGPPSYARNGAPSSRAEPEPLPAKAP